MASGGDRIATPRWTPARTLLLAIAGEAWPPLAPQVCLDGMAFARKRELHATIVGHGLGARLCGAMSASREVHDRVQHAIDTLDWSWQRGLDWRLLETSGDGARRRTVIELIDLPAMAAFHHAIARLLGDTLPVPPPHVTLYTAGGAKGIGLPNPAALARLQLRDVTADELGFEPRAT